MPLTLSPNLSQLHCVAQQLRMLALDPPCLPRGPALQLTSYVPLINPSCSRFQFFDLCDMGMIILLKVDVRFT